MKKVGILGGTFNPIHIGHLMLAQNALEMCKLDKVLIIPSGVSYLKDPAIIASSQDRLAMAEISIKNNPLFELSTIETSRKGNSYTYETLDELLRLNGDYELFYIVGADTLFSMEKWKNPELIFDKCSLICAPRDNYGKEVLEEKKQELINKYNAKIIFLDVQEVEISSSFIRDMLNKGYSARYYLADGVSEYIKEKHLYQ